MSLKKREGYQNEERNTVCVKEQENEKVQGHQLQPCIGVQMIIVTVHFVEGLTMNRPNTQNTQ